MSTKATIKPENIYSIVINGVDRTSFRLESQWNGMSRFVDANKNHVIVYDPEPKPDALKPYEATVVLITDALLAPASPSVAGTSQTVVAVDAAKTEEKKA